MNSSDTDVQLEWTATWRRVGPHGGSGGRGGRGRHGFTVLGRVTRELLLSGGCGCFVSP